MSSECGCQAKHVRRRIVLTGGPGAGKTAVLEVLRHSLCKHVTILPESAGIVFGGGFPRVSLPGAQRAAQRAIYYVQVELEECLEAAGPAIMLCDRGAVDGYAYWPGPGSLWSAVGTTREKTLSRYDVVIHLRVPPAGAGYNNQNPLRIESAMQARQIDDRILEAWEGHPCRYIVEPSGNFLEKTQRALSILRTELPECCRDHASTAMQAMEEQAKA
jgi:predicted ATPase